MERRLLAIFMADMVGYARLMEEDEPMAISLIHELRERSLEPAIAARGGEMLKRMGDGWIASFDSAQSAVDTAMAVQTALAGHGKIRLRLAVHLGEITRDEKDFYGNGINVAARLLTEAAPGGVIISRDLLRQLDQRLASSFADSGTFRLKNLAQPVSAWQWRPGQMARGKDGQRDEIPVIGVEPVTVSADQTLREAAADLSEQLVHLLSRRSGVRVVALDAGSTAETRTTHVLRGRLRLRQESVTLTLTLLLCRDMSVIWSRSYSGDADAVFDLCDRAALQADSELRLQINAYDGERLEGLADDELSPAQLRTRAAALMYRTTTADQRRAGDLLERALELDPNNPTSLAMWAEARFFLATARFERPAEEAARALMASADQAVQLAPRSDYVFYVRTHLRARLSRDVAGARRDIDRMERINPGYVLKFEAQGMTELAAGAWPAAIEAFSRAASMSDGDPYLPIRLYGLATACLLKGEPDSAARHIAEAIELRSNARPYWLLLAEAKQASGDDAGARAARDEAARLPGDPDILAPELPLPDEAGALMADLAPAKP